MIEISIVFTFGGYFVEQNKPFSRACQLQFPLLKFMAVHCKIYCRKSLFHVFSFLVFLINFVSAIRTYTTNGLCFQLSCNICYSRDLVFVVTFETSRRVVCHLFIQSSRKSHDRNTTRVQNYISR